MKNLNERLERAKTAALKELTVHLGTSDATPLEERIIDAFRMFANGLREPPVDIYPMCKSQPAQIDCRIEECKYHVNAECTNPSPAITLNPKQDGDSLHGAFTCWSMERKGDKL